jgi:gas vesicle protein
MNERTPGRTSNATSYSAVTLAFLAGGLAGAAVGLLLAPQAGARTRDDMGRKLQGAAASARDLKGRMVDKVTDAAASARDLRDRAILRGRELRDEGVSRVEAAASALAGKAVQNEPANGGHERDDSQA